MPQGQVHGEYSDGSGKSHGDIVLAFGANLASVVGSPEKTLPVAINKLSSMGAAIRAVSPMYNTPAFPAGNGPDYVNAAAVIRAPWTPEETLAHCHQIEAELGRERVQRWGQRTLDIDLIAVGALVLPDVQTHAHWRDLPLETQMGATPEQLILPHPRLQDRAFVLVPLADVAPEWVHPILGLSVLEMRDALDPALLEEVKPLETGDLSAG